MISINKSDYLDPLSVIIRLFIYSFKNIGTKISIKNNKVTIQEQGIFQSSVRTLFRDSKNDINIMFNPIIFACDKYLNSTNKKMYKYIFECAIIGFSKLKETYVGNEIIYTIDNLKTTIELFINNDNYEIENIISNINSPSYTIKRQIYSSINEVWTEQRLKILFGYINEIEKYSTEESLRLLLYSLNIYMDYIDLCTSNLINSLQ
jgi:hypothetical protein